MKRPQKSYERASNWPSSSSVFSFIFIFCESSISNRPQNAFFIVIFVIIIVGSFSCRCAMPPSFEWHFNRFIFIFTESCRTSKRYSTNDQHSRREKYYRVIVSVENGERWNMSANRVAYVTQETIASAFSTLKINVCVRSLSTARCS